MMGAKYLLALLPLLLVSVQGKKSEDPGLNSSKIPILTHCAVFCLLADFHSEMHNFLCFMAMIFHGPGWQEANIIRLVSQHLSIYHRTF